MAVQIYAGNLPYNTNDEALKSLFEGFGEVVSSKIVKDRDTGRSKGFGFVEMTDSAAADDAIKQLDGSDLGGRKIKVNIARPKGA
ncbi:MAG TPA: RNA-binding protein [Spirochaetota bacterium]|jgi:RNA recognition motif-containing protein|nr:RNA-binding protein [Spirochaetota bacterium]HOR44217.1 RNA-binding protein [Spirochaetota bacterium]HOU84765.1 RNA-binding protein [Spirochaetota bacterium]HPK55671.1 RNA-binding protein [Spirochaetota bacterium]HQE57765.1 RNA-binding protein [Spirochaetota bacterium]